MDPTENPVQWAHRKGRGAISNPPGRYESEEIEFQHDGREYEEEALDTRYFDAPAKSLINYNQSPDIGTGPLHQPLSRLRAWLRLLFRAAQPCLSGVVSRVGLRGPRYSARRMRRKFWHANSGLPDTNARRLAWATTRMPISQSNENSRSRVPFLKFFGEFRHPVSLITKSGLIERDLDILQDMARDNLVEVVVSVTTLDAKLRPYP